MPVRIIPIPFIAAGDDTFAFNPINGDMVMINTILPFDARVKANGVFTNCSYSYPLIHVDNPISNTQVFSFEIEYKLTSEDGWTSGAGFALRGVAYHSLGHIINTQKVRNEICERNNDVGCLCISSKVNLYSKHKPNGSVPYNLGDFALYCHTMIGGISLGSEIYVETSIGGTYSITTAPIPWLYSYKILGYLGTYWVALPGLPYSFMKIESAGTMSDYASPTAGGHGMIGWSEVFTNNDAAGATVTYYVKSYHCNTSGGVFVEGESIEITITHSAKPYSLGTIIFSRAGDTAHVTFAITGSGVTDIRFQTKDHNNVIRTNYFSAQVGYPDDEWIDVVSPDTTFDVDFEYKLDVKYNSSGTFNVVEATRGDQTGFL